MAGWYASLYKGRPWYVKCLSAIASLIVAFLLYLGAVDIDFLGLFGKSPSMNTILNTRPAQASEVYTADSVMLGKYFSENRTPVKYDEVNVCFWHALIDTEDERFFRHFGIDFPAFAAALKDYVLHDEARGASTITQQLAKNLFRVRTEYSTGYLGNIPGLKMLIMKTKEWITAVKLEANFTKEEILTMYANTVDFGSNSYGIKTASKTYFGVSPRDLKPEQAAVLVGMLKATTFYNPRLHPENSMVRRNIVLNNMLLHNHLTRQQYDTLSAMPIKLEYSVENAYDGEANYFREAVRDFLRDWCKENGYDIYTDGLKIYSSINSHMQHYAEEAAWKQMEQLQKKFNDHWAGMNPWQDEHYREIPNFIENIARRLPLYKRLEERFPNQPDSINYYLNLPHPVRLFSYNGKIEKEMSTLDSIRYMEHFMHCGFVALEPQTGLVRAWVGDLDFDTWKYDKVTAQRQPGSTFKLFVYTEAMNQGLAPCDRRQDTYVAIKAYNSSQKKEVMWTPSNANGYFTGANMTLKRAFAQSVNSVAVKLGQELGINRIASTARRMGIRSKLDETPALALGSSDVCLLELVGAYAVIANDGRMHRPQLVERILDRDGHEIYTASSEMRQAVTYHTAFLMQQMLMAGMREPGGTSMSLWNYVRPFSDTDFGGKTGTSNNHSDAWFMGVSPRLVCGAWVGGEYRAIHFRTGQLGQGSRTALPICGRFLEKVLSDKRFSHYHAKFAGPKPNEAILSTMYDCINYAEPDTLGMDSLDIFYEEAPVSDVVTDNEEQPTEPVIPEPATTEEQPADDGTGY
ncbi:MAG: transglycosylase domain-containing protein [Prevotella sp.]|nr:transglycosylase domain-containing protein [Prevotella sp.]